MGRSRSPDPPTAASVRPPPQGPSGGQGARGQEQPAVYSQPEVPEEPSVWPGHLQEHGRGSVGQQDSRTQEPHKEWDCAGQLSWREPREARPHGAGAGGHSGPRGGGREPDRGPTEPGGRASADGEPTLDKLLIAAGVGTRESCHGQGAGREREWHLPVHGGADGQLHEPPADVSHGRESWEEEFHQGQARPALCQAAALQREAEGEHLQVPGHRSPEAGRLHPHPAVHQVVREQLAEPGGDEGAAERAEHGWRWWQQAGAAQRCGQRLLLRPGLPLLHPAPARWPQEGEHQDGRGHQKLREHLHPVQEAYCRCCEWPGHWARSIYPASLWCGLGQWKGMVPDALYQLRTESRRLFHRHVPQDYGRSICQRNAAQRSEANSTGGVQQRAGLTGVLAWDLQPGSHVSHQGARLLQPRRAGGIQGPCALQHEAGAGAGQRAGVWGAQEDLALRAGHGIHAQVREEQDGRVLTVQPPDLTRAPAAGPRGLGQAPTELPLQSRTWDRQAIYCQGVLKYCYFQINNYKLLCRNDIILYLIYKYKSIMVSSGLLFEVLFLIIFG